MKDYIQSDPQWGSIGYAGENMALAGCGPTSVADIVEVIPPTVAAYITSVGGASNGSGTYWEGIKMACDHYGYPCTQLNNSNYYGQKGTQAEKTWLAEMKTGNYYGILLMGRGYYCNGGHYIAIESVDANDNVKAYDVAFNPRSGTHGWNEIVPAGAPGACNTGGCYFSGCVKIFYLVKKKTSNKTNTVITDKIIGLNSVNGGDKNNCALLAQEILRARGYKGADKKVLTLDGSWGNNCQYAMKKFQKDNKLTQTGNVGKNDWTMMTGMIPNGSSRNLVQIKAGSKNDSVLLLQEILRARGFKGKDGNVLELDKSWGNNLTYAWKQYIKKRKEAGATGLSTTKVGIKEWTDLLGM